MKLIAGIITIIIHFTLVATLKLLDNFGFILTTILGSLIIGFVFGSVPINPKNGQIGWGICIGSLISLVLLGCFLFWGICHMH